MQDDAGDHAVAELVAQPAGWSTSSAATVAQPAYQLGATATGLPLDECESSARHAHQQVLFRPRLVARSSTGRRTTAPIIADAG